MSIYETTLSDSTPVMMELNSICIDGGTQPRARLDEMTVQEYEEVLANGGAFPPVVVFRDGTTYWLADGFHRVEAHRRAGRPDLSAEVRQGTQRDALLYAVGANNDHGLRRSPEDKRRAVLTLLKDAEWGEWSDREIAKRCNVTHPFVGELRAILTGNVSSENSADSKSAPKTARTYQTKHGTKAKMKVGKIGKRNSKYSKAVRQVVSPRLAETTREPDLVIANAPPVQEPLPRSAKPLAELVGVPGEQLHPAAPLPNSENVNDVRQFEAGLLTVGEPETLREQGQPGLDAGASTYQTKDAASAPTGAASAPTGAASAPTGAASAAAARGAASAPAPKLSNGQWRAFLNHILDHHGRPITAEITRLLSVSNEARDLGPLLELLEKGASLCRQYCS